MFENKEEFKKIYTERLIEEYGRDLESCHVSEKYLVLAQLVKNYASIDWRDSKDIISYKQRKQLYYFSMEFLIGRLLTNNLMNLGIYDIVKEGLADLNISLSDLEEAESDAALGNGGLGRLAACFLDSLASLGLPGHGNTIRYDYGLFKQLIIDNKQVEVPDIWLKYGNPWEVRKFKHQVQVKFYGDIEMNWTSDGKMHVKHINAETINAVPYDVPIIGYGNKFVNNLRLWKPEPSELGARDKDFIRYADSVSKICQNVYPDDSTEKGRMLRVKQEYFFVSAGVQAILNAHYDEYKTFDNLSDKVVIQMNDTHPILVIPEMMRILMDEYMYDWNKAMEIVSKTVAFTNHTIMQEALEKWPIGYIQTLLPRIWLIIQEIDNRFKAYVMNKTNSSDIVYRTSIIRDGQVQMANMSCAVVFSINGVAQIHTEILKNDCFKDFYNLFPEKFNNKTNGITHRRWLVCSNPQLASLLKRTIGDEYIKHPEKLADFSKYVDDKKIQNEFIKVKKERKEILAKFIEKETGIKVDTNSIFDTQAKRLHAYKRQMLNCMHIIYLYQRMKEDSSFRIYPRTFIFGAKAAPAYTFAKNVIELINCMANVINNDPEISKYMKVVFIPNYRVSVAEILMNATDVSEQISTAGKEASGTGNMKFMMNGAITLGTLDGANVEISRAVGLDNCVIFGNKVEDIERLRNSDYSAMNIYQNNPIIKNIMNSLIDGTWHQNKEEFKCIYDELIFGNDNFFLFADFDEYVVAQQRIQEMYQNQEGWVRSCLINIANSGFFSTDRTISEYNRDIWHLEKIR